MFNKKLDYVLTIAEELNLTRASKRLFISQPTLTLYLNRLEDELGVKLFDRSKSPIVITEAGNYYITEMKKIAASEQLLRNDIKLIANPQQTLIIGIGQVRGQDWLPSILPVFCSIYPNVNIQIVQSTELYMSGELRAHHIDVAIGSLPSSVLDLEIVELMQEKLCLTAHQKFGLIPASDRTNYTAKNPYIIQPEALNGLPFIIPQVSNGIYDNYEKLILDNQINPSRTISVNNLRTGLSLAVKGLGIQVLSSSILQTVSDQEELKYLDFCMIRGMEQLRKCIVAYDPKSKKKNMIQDLIRIIQTEVLPKDHFISMIETKHETI